MRGPLGFQERQDDVQHHSGLGQGLPQSCCSSAPGEEKRSQMESMNRGSQKAGTPKPSHRKPSKRHPTNNRGKICRAGLHKQSNYLEDMLKGRLALQQCLKCNMPLAEQNIHSYPAVSRQPNQEHIQSGNFDYLSGNRGAVSRRKRGMDQSVNLSRENI